MIGRRGFITGLISLVAAPAIVRAGLLMPVKVMLEPAVYGRIDDLFLLSLFEVLNRNPQLTATQILEMMPI